LEGGIKKNHVMTIENTQKKIGMDQVSG